MAAPMVHMSSVKFVSFFSKSTSRAACISPFNAVLRGYARRSTIRKPTPVESVAQSSLPHLDEQNVKSTLKVNGNDAGRSMSFSACTHENFKTMNTPEEERFTLPPGVTFEKIGENDKRFGRPIGKAKERFKEGQERTCLLEGKRLILDAVQAGVILKYLYFTKIEHLEGLPIEEIFQKTPLLKVKYKNLSLWSDTSTSSGLMAVAHIPRVIQMKRAENDIPVTLICDNIREPGNLGTIVRTAAAAGCQRVLLTKGCVNAWEPKVLRSGAGSHFRIPIVSGLDWAAIANQIDNETFVAMADSSPSVPVGNWCEADLNRMSEIFADSMEIETDEADDEEVEESDASPSSTTHRIGKRRRNFFKKIPFENNPYYDVDFKHKNTAIIIGGETRGLSAEAHKFTFERQGQKVHIPMIGGVDSLNSAIASSVLLFEIRKQMNKK